MTSNALCSFSVKAKKNFNAKEVGVSHQRNFPSQFANCLVGNNFHHQFFWFYCQRALSAAIVRSFYFFYLLLAHHQHQQQQQQQWQQQHHQCQQHHQKHFMLSSQLLHIISIKKFFSIQLILSCHLKCKKYNISGKAIGSNSFPLS